MKFHLKKPRSLLGRIVFWGVPALLVLLIIGFFWLRSWLGSYLESEAFRQWLGSMTSKQLDARCTYEPFHFSGLAVKAEGFKAQGTEKAAFSTLEIDKIRTAINLSGLWNKALEIDDVEVARFQISLGHTGAPPVPESEIGVQPAQAKTASSSHSTWLSPKLDLRKLVIHEADVLWGENTTQAGSVAGTEVTATPNGEAWNILLQGGTISQKGGPDMKLDHIKVHYQNPIVDISEGLLVFPPGGSIGLTGEVNTAKNLDVHIKVNGIPVKPFLPPDAGAKLEGNVFADVKVSGTMPMEGAPEVSGVGHLENGYVEGIPILDFFAKLFHSPKFGRIPLNTASASFVYAGQKVTVTNLVVESKGLMSVTGHFVVNNSQIDGHFEIGVASDITRVVPGLDNLIFTRAEGGYRWTPMNVTGPLSSPQTDLAQRIEKAIPGAVVGVAEDVIKEVPKVPDLKKAGEGLLKNLPK